MQIKFLSVSFVSLLATGAYCSPIFTSFEAPTFSVGSIDGQDGWATTSANNFGIVSGPARTGNQSLRWQSGTSTEDYPGGYAWKYLDKPETQEFTAEVSIYLDPTGSADRIYGIQLESSERLGPGAFISNDGSLYVTDGAPFGASPIATLTSPSSRWITLQLHYNPGENVLSAIVDGHNYNLGGFDPMNSVLTADLYSDYLTDSSSQGTAYFDDFRFAAVPEPASIGALAFGIGMVLRRRTRSRQILNAN